jgi:hypothetical protein
MVNGNKFYLQSRLSLRDALFRPTSREPQKSNRSDKMMKRLGNKSENGVTWEVL